MPEIREYLRGLDRLAVAFSGGTDSSALAAAALDVLGKERVLLLHAASVFLPECDRCFTEHFRELGWPLRSVELDPLSVAAVAANGTDRCYHCKKMIFAALLREAEKAGFPMLADGTNTDDLRDFRPGMRAAEELHIQHPFLVCGMDKKAVRTLAKAYGLANWDLPASACLASRIPAGTALTAELLQRIGKAENVLSVLGFRGFRVRFVRSGAVRLEMAPADFPALLAVREKVLAELAELGFANVTLDLRGYRMGGGLGPVGQVGRN